MTNFDLSTAFVTAGITAIFGLLLFVLQQIIDRYYFEPRQKLKEVIEEIAIALIHYSNLYTNPTNYGTERWDSPMRISYSEASIKTRELASKLKVRSDNIPKFGALIKSVNTISQENINIAYSKLIALSNSYSNEGRSLENADLAEEIRNLLKISLK